MFTNSLSLLITEEVREYTGQRTKSAHVIQLL